MWEELCLKSKMRRCRKNLGCKLCVISLCCATTLIVAQPYCSLCLASSRTAEAYLTAVSHFLNSVSVCLPDTIALCRVSEEYLVILYLRWSNARHRSDWERSGWMAVQQEGIWGCRWQNAQHEPATPWQPRGQTAFWGAVQSTASWSK